jgi:hypothetical protein
MWVDKESMCMIWCFRGCEDSFCNNNTEYGDNIFFRNVRTAYQTMRHHDSKHDNINIIYTYCFSFQIT